MVEKAFFLFMREYEANGSIVHASFEYFSAESNVDQIFERQHNEHPDVVVRLRVPFRIADFNGDDYAEENVTQQRLNKASEISFPLYSFVVFPFHFFTLRYQQILIKRHLWS
jgi:hypothetical protein